LNVCSYWTPVWEVWWQVCDLRLLRATVYAGAYLWWVQLRLVPRSLCHLRRSWGVWRLLLQGVHHSGERCKHVGVSCMIINCLVCIKSILFHLFVHILDQNYWFSVLQWVYMLSLWELFILTFTFVIVRFNFFFFFFLLLLLLLMSKTYFIL
jgi:hypothetical protein